jgi:hypothetical protein
LFLFYIKSQSRATKQVLAATAGLFTPNGWEYAGKPCSLINQLQNVVFLNLIAMESKWFWPWFWGFGLLYFNAKFNLIQTRTTALLFVTFLLFPSFLWRNLQGYSIESYFIKSINPKSIHQKKYSSCRFRYLIFSHQYYFLFLIFAVDLPYFTHIASIYLVASSLPTFQF